MLMSEEYLRELPMKKNTSHNRRRSAPAFTLLEMMLVVLIIGLLAGVVGWNIVGQGNKARIAATRASMKTISAAIESYQLDKGEFPADLNLLVSSQRLKEVAKDAWKNEFTYFPSNSVAGRGYTLYSAGPDKQAGNEDDIDFWVEDTEQQ